MPLPAPLRRLCLPALALLLCPAGQAFAAPTDGPDVPGGKKAPTVELYGSRAEEAPSVRAGVFPLPGAPDRPRYNVGLGTFWNRLSFVNPYLGTGLSVARPQPQPQAPEHPLGVDAAPWLGGGVTFNVKEGASVDLGLRSMGRTNGNLEADRAGGTEAGVQLNLKW